MNTATLVVKELLITLRDASDMFLPLKTALVGFLAAWDVYDRTAEVQEDFIELGSKLSALNAILSVYHDKRLGDANLQERLEAIAIAISQLSEAIMAKQERTALRRAAQSMGDVAVIRIMFRRVTSLLEVFQFEAQIRAETLLVTILERLDTDEQHNVTNVDAVQVIIAHMDQQHSSTLELTRAILDQLQSEGVSESVVNNNSNQNDVEGVTDLDNNNANEIELEVDDCASERVVNNNSNVNHVFGAANLPPAGSGPRRSHSSGSSRGAREASWPRSRISNNNSNKIVVRRSSGTQKARPNGTVA